MTRRPHPPIEVTPALVARFERSIRKTDGCWLWTRQLNQKGYGQFAIGKVSYKAHRVAFELATGTHPGERLVCHSCDNPMCVNPAHLWLGDARSNARDMIRKGRGRFQRGCPNCGFIRNKEARMASSIKKVSA